MGSRSGGLIPDVFNDLEIGITLHDPDTGDILDVNDRLERLYGYSAAQLREMSVGDYTADSSELTQERAHRRISQAAAGEPQTFEWHVETADGERIWVRVRLNRATLDGEPYVVAEIREITAQKERERELARQNERLDQFASMVSHDLRNPLQVAKERLAAAREETESTHFENIARAHDRMETIVEETLTLARQGETVDEMEPLDLDEAVQTWWEQSETGAATLRTEPLPTVLCDDSRLRHVFENLFRNAAVHADDTLVEVGALDDGFYVADDGPGIPTDRRDTVFEAGHSTAEDGAGLGLTIVRDIVDAHGWEVDITDGDTGRDGTRFEITGVELVE
jgi:PAS domain S-box-containing protein